MDGQKKVFEQLTDVELLALTQEEIDWYIKLKKAEAGVRILKCPETPEYRSIPERDLTLFDVNGFNFIDKETAEEVANIINSHVTKAFRVDYDWNRGSEFKYAKPYDGTLVNVQIEKVFTKATYDSIKDILTSNKKIEEAYKKLKNEYDEQEEKSTELIEKVYNAISEARTRKEQSEEYIARIQEYIRLANGDVTIAWNFFDKAYSVDPSVKTKIMESDEYQTAIKGY